MLSPQVNEATDNQPLDVVERFLKPISSGEPCGSDLSPAFPALNELRREAYRKEQARPESTDATGDSQSLQWHTYTKRALLEWKKVAASAETILLQQSKDLRVAVWYTEALTRTEGFAGLRSGIRLTRRLIEEFWPNLFPQPTDEDKHEQDRGGYEAILNPLKVFDFDATGTGLLRMPIQTLPLSQGNSPACYIHVVEAQAGLRNSTDHQQLMVVWEEARRATDPRFFDALRSDLDNCIKELELLGGVLIDKCPNVHRPTLRIAELLKDCRNYVGKISAESESAAATDTGNSDVLGQAVAPIAAEFASREEALSTLLEVAQYFLRAELHSPIAYLLLRAESWGRMPLMELLKDVISSDDARSKFVALTGTKEISVTTNVSAPEPPERSCADTPGLRDVGADIDAKPASTPPAMPEGPPRPKVLSRGSALIQIQRVADYFRRIEPHSPVAHQLDRAVRWGRMSLEQLLAEVIPDTEAQKSYRDLTGMPLPTPSKS